MGKVVQWQAGDLAKNNRVGLAVWPDAEAADISMEVASCLENRGHIEPWFPRATLPLGSMLGRNNPPRAEMSKNIWHGERAHDIMNR
jgi:hypothetical protein